MANIYDLSDTWNDAGTTFNAIKMNVTDTASAAGSLLMDLQVDGVSKAKLAKNAILNTSETGTLALIANRFSHGLYSVSGGCALSSGGNNKIWAVGAGAGATTISFMTSAAQPFTSGAILTYDAADTLAQRNGTNAQTFNIYNTYTDSSNYERGFLKWASNVLRIGTENAGTGTARALEFQTNGTTRLTLTTAGGISLFPAFGAPVNLPVNRVFSYADGSGTGMRFGLFTGGEGLLLGPDAIFGFAPVTAFAGNPDIILARDAANTLAQRNSTNAQTFNLYNTYTDASNYERASIGWNVSNQFEITPEKLGTGTNREMLLSGALGSYIRFKTDNQIDVSGGGTVNIAFKNLQTDLLKTVRIAYDDTVATLPASPSVGMISRVTDGDSGLTFGNTVVNSGAGATPYLVWYNGTNWTVIGA